MKALMLKDFYMIKKYCRSYLLVLAVFSAVSVFDPTWLPSAMSLLCVMAAMLPVTLMAYDERSHWNEYCAALPYGNGAFVSSKYVLCLICQLAVAAVFLLIRIIGGGADMTEFLISSFLAICCSCVFAAITLPLVLWLGVEKGRVLYYVFIVIGFAASGALKSLSISEKADIRAVFDILAAVLPILAAAAFIASWAISVIIYGKKEIR